MVPRVIRLTSIRSSTSLTRWASWRSIMPDALVEAARQLQRLERVAHRRQRTPQLVCEHREELVLAPIRGFQFAEQAVDPLLRLLTVHDVPRDLRCANDVPGLVTNGRDGQRDVNGLPVHTHAYRLEMLDALAGSDA